MPIFSLTLDDHSPHLKSGLNFESIEWCNHLIKLYPDIKIDLFVPAAFGRLGEKPCYISKNKEWVKRVKDLPANYAINLHGLYHRRSVADFSFHRAHPASNNDEFQFLNGPQTTTILNRVVEEFGNADLPFRPVFRAPGWKISVAAAKVLIDRGFKIAGDAKYFKLCAKSIVNFSKHSVIYNWDLAQEHKSTGDIVAFGHTSLWCKNVFLEPAFNKVIELLKNNNYIFKKVGEL